MILRMKENLAVKANVGTTAGEMHAATAATADVHIITSGGLRIPANSAVLVSFSTS